MKHWYNGVRITNKLNEAINSFEEKCPDRNYIVEAFEDFFEKEGIYFREGDKERYNSQ